MPNSIPKMARAEIKEAKNVSMDIPCRAWPAPAGPVRASPIEVADAGGEDILRGNVHDLGTRDQEESTVCTVCTVCIVEEGEDDIDKYRKPFNFRDQYIARGSSWGEQARRVGRVDPLIES